ncbi:MAG: 2'-5' RNA ligase family protein [Pseudomonadales bacterium]
MVNINISRRKMLHKASLLFTGALLPSGVFSLENKAMSSTLYAMALVPPPELSAVCAAIREQFDPAHSDKTFPHITLKQPFTLLDNPIIQESVLLQATQQLCSQQPPLKVALKQVGRFDSPTHGSVVHVRVDLSPAFQQLQQALVKKVAAVGCVTPHLSVEQEIKTYYPHLTLAQGLSPEAATAMLDHDMRAVTEKSFLADTVVVGRRDTNQVWQRIGVFPLLG